MLKQNDIKKKHDFHYGPKPWLVVSTKDKQVTIAKDNKSLSRHGNKLKLLKRNQMKVTHNHQQSHPTDASNWSSDQLSSSSSDSESELEDENSDNIESIYILVTPQNHMQLAMMTHKAKWMMTGELLMWNKNENGKHQNG